MNIQIHFRRLIIRMLLGGSMALVLVGCMGGESSSSNGSRSIVAEAMSNPQGWVGAWSAAPYGPFPNGPFSSLLPVDILSMTSYMPNNESQEQSFRMIINPTVGGEVLRVRFSNLMGDRPIRIEPAQVGKALVGPSLIPGSNTALQFRGQSGVTIPPGQEVMSDPVEFKYAYGENLAVSFHVVGNSGPITWHAVSFGINYVSLPGAGDVTADELGVGFPQINTGWFFISGLDVYDTTSQGSIVALGDSITDGAYIVPTTNTRWPDFLAQRIQNSGLNMSVLNQGINSNTVTDDGINPGEIFKGPSAESRFERDVLGRSGVKTLILFEGTNDLGAGLPAEVVYEGLNRIVEKAKSKGLCVILGTIMPRLDVALGWDRAVMEPERQKLNALIRSNASADHIVDFEAAMASPLDPTLPNVPYFFPDLLHPNSLGFFRMAEQFNLESLVPTANGDCR